MVFTGLKLLAQPGHLFRKPCPLRIAQSLCQFLKGRDCLPIPVTLSTRHDAGHRIIGFGIRQVGETLLGNKP